MIGYCRNILKKNIKANKLKYSFTLICLILGISLGILNAKNAEISSDSYIERFFSAYIIGDVSGTSVFLKSVFLNFRAVLLIWISGFFLWLTPLNFLEVGAKGYTIGYTYTYLISAEHLRGFIFSLATQFIQNTILIPLFVIFSVLQFNFALNFDKRRSSQALYRERKKILTGNILLLLLFSVPILICGYIDGFMLPFFIKMMF